MTGGETTSKERLNRRKDKTEKPISNVKNQIMEVLKTQSS